MFFRFVHYKTFFISFIIGIISQVLTNAHKVKITVYPTPETYAKILYKDKADNCYRYEQEIVKCPPKKTSIFNIPIQNTN
jgi:hypothetical protein